MLIITPVPCSNPARLVRRGTMWTCQWNGPSWWCAQCGTRGCRRHRRRVIARGAARHGWRGRRRPHREGRWSRGAPRGRGAARASRRERRSRTGTRPPRSSSITTRWPTWSSASAIVHSRQDSPKRRNPPSSSAISPGTNGMPRAGHGGVPATRPPHGRRSRSPACSGRSNGGRGPPCDRGSRPSPGRRACRPGRPSSRCDRAEHEHLVHAAGRGLGQHRAEVLHPEGLVALEGREQVGTTRTSQLPLAP